MALKTRNSQLSNILATQQGKTYTVLGVTVAVVLIMIFFAIRPAWISITNKISENRVKGEYIEDAEAKIEDLDTLAIKRDNYREGVRYLNDYYLSETPVESFISGNIIETVRNLGLTINFIRIDVPEEVEESNFDQDIDGVNLLAEINITFNAEGSFEALEQLVRQLEENGKVFNINNVSMSINEDSDLLTWQLVIQASTYFWDINDIKSNRNV